jgi:hypothetical protein
MRRLLSVGVALAIAAVPMSACKEVEEESSGGYEPSKLESVKGSDLKRVTYTAEGVKRTGVRTAPLRRSGPYKVVPYAALIYDAEGKTYVYTSPKPLSYLRQPVEVARIEGERVLLSAGPPVGAEVVTIGAAEVYGTELEIESG